MSLSKNNYTNNGSSETKSYLLSPQSVSSLNASGSKIITTPYVSTLDDEFIALLNTIKIKSKDNTKTATLGGLNWDNIYKSSSKVYTISHIQFSYIPPEITFCKKVFLILVKKKRKHEEPSKLEGS